MPLTRHSPVSLAWAAKIVVALLALTFLKHQAGQLQALDFTEGDLPGNLRAITVFWLGLLGPGFYLVALWSLGNVFDRIEAWDSFGPALVKGLRRTGQSLVAGAVCAIFAAPSLTVWLTDRFRGIKWHAEIGDVMLGFLGLALFLIASTGKHLRDELEQIV